jgi:hypothetical protein
MFSVRSERMNARQQLVTAVMSLLMLATFVMMPAQPVKTGAPEIKRVGMVSAKAENRTELPADQVRDLAY